MKRYYFIQQTHKNDADITGVILLYIMLFMAIYFMSYEKNQQGFIIITISFIGFIVATKRVSKISKKYSELHYYYPKNILFLMKEKTIFFEYIFMIILSMFILHPFNGRMLLFDVLAIILSYLFLAILTQMYSQGMYIDDKSIYYILYKRQNLDLNSILGIKIEREQFSSRGSSYFRYYYNKHLDTYLYCMLFLNNIDDLMGSEYYGSIGFQYRFPGSVIVQTVYDAEVIDYIKQIKPDIIVMQDIR